MSRRVCLAAGAALAAVLVLAIGTAVDFRISDAVFATGGTSWPVPHSGPVRMLFYEGAKYALVAFAACLIAGLGIPPLRRRLHLERREALFVLACLVIVPAVIALIKYHSGVVCASELARYGGRLPDAAGHFTFAKPFAGGRTPGCWPSGHASGGFALFALGALARPACVKRRLWMIGLAAGTAMGAYQVLRGAHFVSHILVTALLAQLLVCVLARVMLPGEGAGAWANPRAGTPGGH